MMCYYMSNYSFSVFIKKDNLTKVVLVTGLGAAIGFWVGLKITATTDKVYYFKDKELT